MLVKYLHKSCEKNQSLKKNVYDQFTFYSPFLLSGPVNTTWETTKTFLEYYYVSFLFFAYKVKEMILFNTINDIYFYSFQIVLPNLLQNIEHLWSKLLAFQWMKQLLWCWFHMAVPFGPKSKELLALKIKPIMPALGLECYVKTK